MSWAIYLPVVEPSAFLHFRLNISGAGSSSNRSYELAGSFLDRYISRERVGTLANGGHFSEEWALWAIDELGFFGVSCVRTFFKDEKRGRLSILGIMDVGISGLRDGFVHQLV